jgi:hypothetical protein
VNDCNCNGNKEDKKEKIVITTNLKMDRWMQSVHGGYGFSTVQKAYSFTRFRFSAVR